MNWKHLVPASLRRWRHVLASLTPPERLALRRAALDSLLHPRRRDWRGAVRDGRAFVFVCHGNIIRSPLAAAAFQGEAAARSRPVEVSSAGLSARPGEPADPRAIDSAAERGLPLGSHRARALDAIQVESADAIFVMDHVNLGRLLARYPQAAGRVFLLAGCRPDGRVGLSEIHDPVSGGLADVRVAHDEVIAAVRTLASAWDGPGA